MDAKLMLDKVRKDPKLRTLILLHTLFLICIYALHAHAAAAGL